MSLTAEMYNALKVHDEGVAARFALSGVVCAIPTGMSAVAEMAIINDDVTKRIARHPVVAIDTLSKLCNVTPEEWVVALYDGVASDICDLILF